jgi:hypothetical protein
MMARAMHELIAESVASIGCSQFGLNLSMRFTDCVTHWIDDPVAFRAGMAVFHDAAASLINAVALVLAVITPLDLAA